MDQAQEFPPSPNSGEMVVCPSCDGRGSVTCSACGGKCWSGWARTVTSSLPPMQAQRVFSVASTISDPPSIRCNSCSGTGSVRCSRCGGTGHVPASVPPPVTTPRSDSHAVQGKLSLAEEEVLERFASSKIPDTGIIRSNMHLLQGREELKREVALYLQECDRYTRLSLQRHGQAIDLISSEQPPASIVHSIMLIMIQDYGDWTDLLKRECSVLNAFEVARSRLSLPIGLHLSDIGVSADCPERLRSALKVLNQATEAIAS